MALWKYGARATMESAGYDGTATDPDVTVLSNGNILVSWSENLNQPTDVFDDADGAVFARILRPNGIAISDIFQVNDTETFLQYKPQIIPQYGGGFAIGWTNVAYYGSHTTDTDSFIRFFGADGTAVPNFRIDVIQDTPISAEEPDSAKQVLSEIVELDARRFAVILENDQTYVYNSSGTLIARPAVKADDMVQLANGNIVSAVVSDDAAHAGGLKSIKLTLTNGFFAAPTGLPGVYDPLSFYVDGTISRDKAENNLELVALKGGGFVLAFVEGGNNSSIRLEFISAEGMIENSADPIICGLKFDSPNGEFDMIALSGGGVALAMVRKDAVDGNRVIDLIMFNEDGRKVETKQIDPMGGVGNLGFPSLSERSDGKIVLVYTDSSSSSDNPIQLQLYNVVDFSSKHNGTAGNDVLNGIAGNDLIYGLAGNDEIVGRRGNDLLRGGDGNDTLEGGAGRDNLRGNAHDDVLNGGDGADGLGGGSGNDRLSGGNGRDVLGGGQGNDILKGGSGADVLKGGYGNDTLTGGPGRDVFVFVNGQTGRDTITDFDATRDFLRLDLEGANANALNVSIQGANTAVSLGTIEMTLPGVHLVESDIVFQFI